MMPQPRLSLSTLQCPERLLSPTTASPPSTTRAPPACRQPHGRDGWLGGREGQLPQLLAARGVWGSGVQVSLQVRDPSHVPGHGRLGMSSAGGSERAGVPWCPAGPRHRGVAAPRRGRELRERQLERKKDTVNTLAPPRENTPRRCMKSPRARWARRHLFSSSPCSSNAVCFEIWLSSISAPLRSGTAWLPVGSHLCFLLQLLCCACSRKGRNKKMQ